MKRVCRVLLIVNYFVLKTKTRFHASKHFEQAAHIVSDYVFGEAGFLGDVADKYLQTITVSQESSLIAIHCIG